MAAGLRLGGQRDPVGRLGAERRLPQHVPAEEQGQQGDDIRHYQLGCDYQHAEPVSAVLLPARLGARSGQGGGWGLIHPTNWFFNSYLPGDYRRGADTGWASTTAYVWGGCSVSGLCPTFNDTVKHVIRHDTLADGPMPYKHRKSDNGVNWMPNDR